MYTKNTCEAGDCEWGGSECGPADNGQACAKQTTESCPARCVLEFDKAGEVSSCRDATCADIFSETACAAKTGCSFDADVTRCFATGSKVPCDARSLSESICTKDTGCEFDAAVFYCKVKGEQTPCNLFFAEAECTKKSCKWYSDASTCTDGSPPACNFFFSIDPCNQRDDCVWTAVGCKACQGADCDYVATTTAATTTLPLQQGPTLPAGTVCKDVEASDACYSPTQFSPLPSCFEIPNTHTHTGFHDRALHVACWL